MEAKQQLTIRQKNICEYGGLLGVLLSLTCLVQHLIAAIPNAITNPMIPVYLLTAAAFAMLALLKSAAIYLLIPGALLTLVIEWRYITHYAFSLVVLLLFLYLVILMVILLTEQIPQRIRKMEQLRKAEEEEWAGKI